MFAGFLKFAGFFCLFIINSIILNLLCVWIFFCLFLFVCWRSKYRGSTGSCFYPPPCMVGSKKLCHSTFLLYAAAEVHSVWDHLAGPQITLKDYSQYSFTSLVKGHLAKLSSVTLVLNVKKWTIHAQILFPFLQLWSDGSHSICWCSKRAIKSSVFLPVSSSIVC